MVKKSEPFPGTVLKRIREQKVDGKPLGRHVHHDPRSLRFLVKPRAALAVSKEWPRRTPILDQDLPKPLGSCTGNAADGVLGTDPFYDIVKATKPDWDFGEPGALSIYELATQLDPFKGTYPPTDTGSDGLSAAKACMQKGLISGFQHCTSLDAVITALQTGPLITGVNWYDNFDEPDSNGFVSLSPNASIRGGHEFEIYRVDIELQLLHAHQSWGPYWGLNGTFSFSFNDYARLLSEQGDATVFVPLSQPAPTPTPVPVSDADRVFVQTVGVSCTRTRPYKTWKAAKGL